MKPNDDSAKLPVEQRPFKVLIISGPDRRQYNCPGVDSKSRTLKKMAEMLPIRYFKMRAGKPPHGSSLQILEELGLNKDATWHTKKGERQKLRDDD
ncbi:MAG: hypothetical protein ABIO04_01230 [Ferruginibacter sp.]